MACRLRKIFVFTYNRYQRGFLNMEIMAIIVISLTQIFFSATMIFVTEAYQPTWNTIDNIYIGTVSFFIIVLPLLIYVDLLYIAPKRKEKLFTHKMTILLMVWSFGRFVRAVNIFSTLSVYTTWESDFSQSGVYYSLYVSVLYLFMEVFPIVFALLPTFSRHLGWGAHLFYYLPIFPFYLLSCYFK